MRLLEALYQDAMSAVRVGGACQSGCYCCWSHAGMLFNILLEVVIALALDRDASSTVASSTSTNTGTSATCTEMS